MPLTPEDVQNKEFTPVRLREGYDMAEVDEFLDEVEAELARLYRENEELREKLAAVTRGGPAASAEPMPPARQPQQKAGPAPAAPAPMTGVSAHDAAAKVLALAQKTADELVADAKAEADRLLSDARSRAQQLDADTKAKSAKIETELRERREQLDRESQQRREQILGQLETERERLELALEELRAFEREYRSRLKAYLEGQLRHLEASGLAESNSGTQGSPPAQPAPAPAPAAQANSQGQKPPEGGSGGGRAVPSLLEQEQPRN